MPEALAGDIIALVGLRESITGDTLCDGQHPILLEPIHFAEAVVSQSIEPESSADKDKLIDTLNALKREDPTFTWGVNKDTGETMMNGMGVLHLEIKKHRMERDFNLKVKVRQPRVSYRETVWRAARVVGEGDARAGHVEPVRQGEPLELEPDEGEQAIVIAQSTAGGRSCRFEFVAGGRAAAASVEPLQSGEVGFPVIKVRATLLDGPEWTRQIVQRKRPRGGRRADAVNRAMQGQHRILLPEPVMRLEVTVPEEYLGSR